MKGGYHNDRRDLLKVYGAPIYGYNRIYCVYSFFQEKQLNHNYFNNLVDSYFLKLIK